MGAIGTGKYSVPGQETVGIQDPVGTQCMELSNDMQYAFASALLDYDANIKEHCRRLRDSQHAAKTPIEAKPSIQIWDV